MAGQEYFGIRIDTDKLEQDAQQAKKAFDGIAEEAVKAGETMDNALGNGAQMAAGKFNMLNVSIQQIARELPSLTMSPQMFFLAISDNLPIFTDALANARKEYELMTAAGQKGVPVWRQLTKSLFSWQTAISLIPTLLLLYGEDVVDFFEQILTGSKKVDLAAETLNKFKEAISKGVLNAQGEITELNLLYEATQNVTESIENRKGAIEALQQKYPGYFGNMSDEDILAGKAAESYERLTNAIVSSAKAKAMANLISENEVKIYEKEIELQDKHSELEKKRADYEQKAQNYAKNRNAFTALQLDLARNSVESTEEEVGNLIDELYKLQKFSTDTKNRIKVEDLIFDPSSKNEDTKKKAVNDLKQYLNELLGLQEDNEERQIELTKTGTEKQLALIELRYRRQIDAVKKLQEDLKKAQGGKLTTEQQGIFGTALSGLEGMKKAETTSVQNKQIEAEKKAMLDYLAEYGDYWEKRKAIANKYQAEIAKASTKGEKLSLQAEMTEALAKLDDEAQKKTSIITKLFGDMATKSVAEMRKIADEAEQLLAFIEGGQYSKDNAFGITEEQFKVLSQSPEKLESIKNEIQNVRDEADSVEPVFERIKDNLKDIFKGGADNNKLNKQLQQLNQDVSQVMQSVGFLADSFANLGDAFGSDALSGIAEGLNVAMGAVNSAMQGAQAGSMFGPIGAAAGAAIGVVTSLASSIAKIHDKKNEKQIQRLQEQIDALTLSYDKLGREAEKAFSTDASKLIEQQNELLRQQQILIRQQITEERDKKKTDEGRIAEWEAQLEAINAQLEENKQKAIDAVTGTDLISAIDQFAQAYADAWQNGTNAAKASTDTVKKLIQASLIEFLKKQLSPDVEKFMKQLADYMADGIIQPWEHAQLDRLQQEMDNVANNYFNQVGDYFKKGNGTQTATAGGFEAMSQDTADELNGRFTALYESNLRIENQISIGNVNLQATKDAVTQMRDITQNCYLELVEIRENTGAVVKPIAQMQKDMAEMKNIIKERL